MYKRAVSQCIALILFGFVYLVSSSPVSAQQFSSTTSSEDLWSGPYSGITLGYGGASIETPAGSVSISGGEIYFLGGFGARKDKLYFGGEFDFSASVFDGHNYWNNRVDLNGSLAGVDWIAGFRGRVGWVEDDTLLFASAGVTYAESDYQGSFTNWGYELGLGFEAPIVDTYYWRTEVIKRFYDDNGDGRNLDDAWSLRLGIIRQF